MMPYISPQKLFFCKKTSRKFVGKEAVERQLLTKGSIEVETPWGRIWTIPLLETQSVNTNVMDLQVYRRRG
jgi:hypothetical protein